MQNIFRVNLASVEDALLAGWVDERRVRDMVDELGPTAGR